MLRLASGLAGWPMARCSLERRTKGAILLFDRLIVRAVRLSCAVSSSAARPSRRCSRYPAECAMDVMEKLGLVTAHTQ
jgi:hypothetical protein